MSDEAAFTPEQENDTANVRRVLVIGAITLTVFAAGIVWVIAMLRSFPKTPDTFVPPEPNQLHASEVGIVDQPLFEGDRRLSDLNAYKHQWLNSYGWVDRDAGIIHIPIDRAMERVATEARR